MPASVTIYANARPTADDGRRQDLKATGDDYAEARELLDEQVPAGWLLLGISQWPINTDTNTDNSDNSDNSAAGQ